MLSTDIYKKISESMVKRFGNNPNVSQMGDTWVIALYSTEDRKKRLCNIDKENTKFELHVTLSHDPANPAVIVIKPNLASFPLFDYGKIRVLPDLMVNDLGSYVAEVVDLTEMYITIRLHETDYKNSIYEQFGNLTAAMTPDECKQLLDTNQVGAFLRDNLRGFEQKCDQNFAASNEARRKTAEFVAKKNLELMKDLVEQQKQLAEVKAKYAQYRKIIIEEENFDQNKFMVENKIETNKEGVELATVVAHLKKYKDDLESITQTFGEQVLSGGDITETAMREYLKQRENYYRARFLADASEKLK